VALDDADRIAGDAVAEETLFHLYNRLAAAKGFLVLTMQNPVAQTGITLPDLRSRLLTLPVAMLQPPDDVLLAALIVKQFRDRQITVGVDVVDYLVSRVERTAAGMRDMVERLDRASLAEGRKISVGLARRVLDECA